MTKSQKSHAIDAEHELTEWIVARGLQSRSGPWLTYHDGALTACLDGDFTAKELAAIAFYMLLGHTDKDPNGNSAGKPKT